MDWDKCNFKRINQRRTEAGRWEKRDGEAVKKSSSKGSSHQPSKKKKKRGKR